MIVAQFSAAYAQTTTPAAPITGTIQNITLQTDTATGDISVVVYVLDSSNQTQTVGLSVDSATSLGLVTIDSTTHQPVVNSAEIGQSISINSSQIIATPPATPTEEPQNPVAGMLAMFFSVDQATINGYHADGFGYGLIAQALWMSKVMNGDPMLAGAILTAKKTGDYSAFTFTDGARPTNWGQFRKEVMSGNAKDNPGAVMSGAQSGTPEPTGTPSPDDHGPQNGIVQGHGNGNGNGNGNGHGKGKP